MDTKPSAQQTETGNKGKGRTPWGIIAVAIVVIGGILILWQVFSPKSSIIAPSASELSGYGQECTSVFHVYYYDSNANRVAIATLDKKIRVKYEYYDTYELEDGTLTHGFDVFFVNDQTEPITEADFNKFRSQILDFVIQTETNMGNAGYGMLGLSVEIPHWNSIDGYFSSIPSSQLDNSDFGYWDTSRRIIDPQAFCRPEYTEFWLEVEMDLQEDWEFSYGNIVFSDEESFVELEAPDISDFVGTEYRYNASPELELYHGEPFEVEHPVGAFKLSVGSDAFLEIRNAMTELPLTAVYDTDDYGTIYGVLTK